jgi:hypothetical protein
MALNHGSISAQVGTSRNRVSLVVAKSALPGTALPLPRAVRIQGPGALRTGARLGKRRGQRRGT